jgi:biuret amidohydrolase
MSLPPELMGAFQYRMAMAWQRVDDGASPGTIANPRESRKNHDLTLRGSPSEAVFDKITMSAFEGTPLGIALRDCGVGAVAIAGTAIEVGIEPTARHAADLGFIPIIVGDACGWGNESAAKRSLESLAWVATR